MNVPPLPERLSAGHKGTFGTVLVAGGCIGMAGAAGLCAQAVLRSGAGLCRVACPHEVQPQVASMVPCATTIPVAGTRGFFTGDAADLVVMAAGAAGVLAIGPGLGEGDGQIEFIQRVLAGVEVPVVLDADGINCLARLNASECKRISQLVMTPHPGEASRLLGCTIAEVEADRLAAGQEIATTYNCCCLLKGANTLVVDSDRVYTNQTGNSALATGGSGDVLTGLIAGLVAQGQIGFSAASLGAWLHGRAGELAGKAMGEWSVTAMDLLVYLPGAFKERAMGRIG